MDNPLSRPFHEGTGTWMVCLAHDLNNSDSDIMCSLMLHFFAEIATRINYAKLGSDLGWLAHLKLL